MRYFCALSNSGPYSCYYRFNKRSLVRGLTLYRNHANPLIYIDNCPLFVYGLFYSCTLYADDSPPGVERRVVGRVVAARMPVQVPGRLE